MRLTTLPVTANEIPEVCSLSIGCMHWLIILFSDEEMEGFVFQNCAMRAIAKLLMETYCWPLGFAIEADSPFLDAEHGSLPCKHAMASVHCPFRFAMKRLSGDGQRGSWYVAIALARGERPRLINMYSAGN